MDIKNFTADVIDLFVYYISTGMNDRAARDQVVIDIASGYKEFVAVQKEQMGNNGRE